LEDLVQDLAHQGKDEFGVLILDGLDKIAMGHAVAKVSNFVSTIPDVFPDEMLFVHLVYLCAEPALSDVLGLCGRLDDGTCKQHSRTIAADASAAVGLLRRLANMPGTSSNAGG
jgi:hypothetical protein